MREVPGKDMSYYEAAVQVLRSIRQPLTTREVTDQAIKMGLITPRGQTPQATMGAALYTSGRRNSELVKLATPGAGRAKRGSVRWVLRQAAKAGSEAEG